MLDTKGPEIRTGFFKEGIDCVKFLRGDTVEISKDTSSNTSYQFNSY